MQTSRSLARALPEIRRGLTETVAGSMVAIVLGAAGLALFSQVLIPLPFTPVPLSLGSLAAMLLGVTLGPSRGMAAAALYGTAGAAGLPVFAGFQSGVLIASFGYVLGYVAAAGIVGWLAYRSPSASYLHSVGAAAAGTAAVYLFGVPWLMAAGRLDIWTALTLGAVPFLVGDAVKALVVAGTVFLKRQS